jgi:chromosome segregation ATPase
MLDARLKERLRAVAARQPATEAELRKLAEEGRAVAGLIDARLERGERALQELAFDPASSLTEIAATLREVNELRPSLEELNSLLAELNRRAREVRQSWVSSGGVSSA